MWPRRPDLSLHSFDTLRVSSEPTSRRAIYPRPIMEDVRQVGVLSMHHGLPCSGLTPPGRPGPLLITMPTIGAAAPTAELAAAMLC